MTRDRLTADNIALPAWCLNTCGHALIERIIADRPDFIITRGHCLDGGGRIIFTGLRSDHPVAQLRRMFNAWWDANHETATALPEQPNDLIARVLRETADWSDSAPQSDPFLNIAKDAA